METAIGRSLPEENKMTNSFGQEILVNNGCGGRPRSIIWIAPFLLIALIDTPPAVAQIAPLLPQPLGRRNLDLRLQQQRAESNIAENRVTRQAEIARLETRLRRIEERLEASDQFNDQSSGFLLLQLVDRINAIRTEPTQMHTEKGKDQDARLEMIPEEETPLADANTSAETAPSDAQESGSSDAAPNAAPDAAADGKEKDNAIDRDDGKLDFLRLLAEDQLARIDIELVSAKILLAKSNNSLEIVQQMVAKGLAGQPQYELENLEHTRAKMRVERLQKLSAGYRRILDGSPSR
jgi:hypothetical protein